MRTDIVCSGRFTVCVTQNATVFDGKISFVWTPGGGAYDTKTPLAELPQNVETCHEVIGPCSAEAPHAAQSKRA